MAVNQFDSGGSTFTKAVKTESDVTRDDGAIFLSKYRIPADMWDTWAAAAGYPGARWDDAVVADKIAAWAADALYEMFGNWNLVAVGWMYGAGTAKQFQDYYGDAPSGTIMEKVFGETGSTFINDTLNKMAKLATDSPPAGAPPSSPGRTGTPAEVTLKFNPEERPEEEGPQRRGANPAHTALFGVLGSMADRVAGGRRLAVQDAAVQSVPEPGAVVADQPIGNVTPDDTEHLES